MGMFRDFFVFQKDTNLQDKLLGVQEKFIELYRTVTVWIKVSSKTFLRNMWWLITLQRDQKNASFWLIYRLMKWKVGWSYSCPKFQKLVDSDKQLRISSSYPLWHKTILHCAEQNAKSFGEWTMQHLKSWFVHCIMYCMCLRYENVWIASIFSNSPWWEIERFSSQVFVILLNIFNCFWKTHLLKTGDESYLFGWDIE